MIEEVKKRAQKWLDGNYDSETKERVRYLLENDENELIDAFYQDLEFGTGGLRGIMGVGTNRMNKYTVGMATQGLANYIKTVFKGDESIKVVIGHDSRNNSRYFAQITAEVFSANGIKVYLFDELRPLPVVSFALRHLNCQSGVMITASHNPKEYNGYKVFWSDGGQIIPPHDKNVIEAVKNIKNIEDVRFNGNGQNIESIGQEIDRDYLQRIQAQSLSPEIIRKHKDLKIVYTPIHGSGVRLVPAILEKLGFESVYHVPEQDVIDGNFPTVAYPNPEETAGLKMAIDKAKEVDADIVLATDPDADRVAVAVKNLKQEFEILTGNQTAALIGNYLMTLWEARKKLTGNEYVVKTIVTTELLRAIANKYSVECIDVLTGFKWISDVIKQNQGKKNFICGGEESLGFLVGDFVRDKDAVISGATISEIAAWSQENGKTLFETLIDLYIEFGFYKSHLISIVKKGLDGAEIIRKMMEEYRNHPPKEINGSPIVKVNDILDLTEKDSVQQTVKKLNFPKSNVIQYFLEDGSKISIRPSGTEPKIKFYFEVKEKLSDKSQYDEIDALLKQRISDIIKAMELE